MIMSHDCMAPPPTVAPSCDNYCSTITGDVVIFTFYYFSKNYKKKAKKKEKINVKPVTDIIY